MSADRVSRLLIRNYIRELESELSIICNDSSRIVRLGSAEQRVVFSFNTVSSRLEPGILGWPEFSIAQGNGYSLERHFRQAAIDPHNGLEALYETVTEHNHETISDDA